MNENLLNIVKRITAQYGENILGDAARLKGFFSDLAKDEPKPLRMAFGRCIEAGAYNALKTEPNAAGRAVRKTAIAERVRDEHGLDITLCGEALDIIEAALFGTARPAQQPAQQPQYQQPQPQYQQPQYQQPALPSVPAKKHTARTVLIVAGAIAAVATIGVVVYLQQQRPAQAQTQTDQSSTVSDAELRNMAAEIAKIAESAVFEGFDPAESIQHYYFVPLSVDEFQELKGANDDELNFSMVIAYATDDGVIKARRAGYNANYGVIVYSENGKVVLGLANVTLKEEDIYLSYDWGTLKYSLSNRLGDIENAIYARTGKTIGLSNVQWTLNTGLSENVKARMNKHNVNYSMTVSTDYAGRYFIVNKRENGRWYYFILYF